MKEKILEALTTKFEGVKPELLERIAQKASKTITTEAEVTTYVEGVTIQQVIDAEGDRRATDAQKTAVANYERKHNLKDGKAVESSKSEPKQNDDDDDTPAWAKALLEDNKALKERLNAMDGERTIKTRKAQLDEALKDMPDKVKEMYTKNFERYNFKDDDDFGTFLEETKTSATAFANDLKTKSAIVTPPKTGYTSSNNSVSPTVQARIDVASKQTVPSAIQG